MILDTAMMTTHTFPTFFGNQATTVFAFDMGCFGITTGNKMTWQVSKFGLIAELVPVA